MDGRRGARSSLGVQSSSTLKHSKSVISGATQAEESLSITGGYFPFKLTATLAALKIVGGCMLIGLGAAAIVQHAGYAGHAAGIWDGVLVIISGVLGAYTVRTRALRVYVILFLVSSLINLLTSILLIIYSATGLAQDANEPYGVEKSDSGDLVPVSEINITSREAGMLINTLLIILGFLDIIFSLPSVILCLRELCDCYDPR